MKLMKKYPLCFSSAREFNYVYFDTIRLCSLNSNKFVCLFKQQVIQDFHLKLCILFGAGIDIILLVFCCYFAVILLFVSCFICCVLLYL